MTLKKHNAGVHCHTNGVPPMASIFFYAFHFHLAFNFRLCTLKMLQLLGTPSPGPLLGLRPWTPLLNR